jgi:hypothetical protein
MKDTTAHTLSAASLGTTLLLIAALIIIGISTNPGQMDAARITLGAAACLSGGSWLALRQREEARAAGRTFFWGKTVGQLVLWLIIALGITALAIWAIQ